MTDKAVGEALEWIRCMKHNYTVDFAEIPTHCDTLTAEVLRLRKVEEAAELALGFCVDFRQNNDCWQNHPGVGFLFAKLTIALARPEVRELGDQK